MPAHMLLEARERTNRREGRAPGGDAGVLADAGIVEPPEFAGLTDPAAEKRVVVVEIGDVDELGRGDAERRHHRERAGELQQRHLRHLRAARICFSE